MTLVEVKKIFDALGWHTPWGARGRYSVVFHLPDRILGIIPVILATRGVEEKLMVEMYLSTLEFNEACTFVANDEHENFLACSSCPPRIDAPELQKKNVRKVSGEVVAWGKRQDIGDALEECAEPPTSSADASPCFLQSIRHIVALALLGDERRLRFYQESFDASDRLDFLLPMTGDFVDRALTLAQRKNSRRP